MARLSSKPSSSAMYSALVREVPVLATSTMRRVRFDLHYVGLVQGHPGERAA
eukprot:CAMPEP_0113667982 /NCGR_PEP_ID=MMETSP0038_2-20120614/3744_1 /TAXON_ID=2898 /ORGANISM="Cryptomonas paramecium" /LENGTH=51 /DNA_ID=CAMNT_0000583669 /DNA_START=695 /DNA_END=846 /DNA_ORIENTATION=- /assembly_acc=CAM_ASM_000170